MWTNYPNERTGYYFQSFIDSQNCSVTRTGKNSLCNDTIRHKSRQASFFPSPSLSIPSRKLSTVSINFVANNRQTRVIGDDYLLATYPLPPPSPAPASNSKFPDFNNLLHGLRIKKLGQSKFPFQPALPMVDRSKNEEEVFYVVDDDDQSHHARCTRRLRFSSYSSQKIKPTRQRRKLPIVPMLAKFKVSPTPSFCTYSSQAAQYSHIDLRHDDDDFDEEKQEIAQGGSLSCFRREKLNTPFSHMRGSCSMRNSYSNGSIDDHAVSEIDFFCPSTHASGATNVSTRETHSSSKGRCFSGKAPSSRNVDVVKDAISYYSEEDNYFCPGSTVSNPNDLMGQRVSFNPAKRACEKYSTTDYRGMDECQIGQQEFNPVHHTVTSLSSNRVVKFDTTLSVIINDRVQCQPFTFQETNEHLNRSDSEWV